MKDIWITGKKVVKILGWNGYTGVGLERLRRSGFIRWRISDRPCPGKFSYEAEYHEQDVYEYLADRSREGLKNLYKEKSESVLISECISLSECEGYIDRKHEGCNDCILLRLVLKEVMKDLKGREEMVLKMRYGMDGYNPMTLEVIGKKFGVTRERIRQIENKGLRRLRKPIRAKRLRIFLEG